MARFCPLFSGSSGNSFYIGSARAGILVDAGRSAKQLADMLSFCGIDISAVKAIFVTHEHSDHIAGLRVFTGKQLIPVYASAGTLRELERNGCLSGKIAAEPVGPGGVACAGMMISSFSVPHDSAECVGFRIQTEDGRVAAVSTDLGTITPEAHKQLLNADLTVLESNHDIGMLRNGPYPYPLKRRILSETGHLSNSDCADELELLAKAKASRFVLAHLSRDNNTPELAFQTSLCALTVTGMKQNTDFTLSVAPRENRTGEMIIF